MIGEAERIKRLKGRVFAAWNEPSAKRVWLPHHNTPGLAMSRALGDYCLKNYGVISEPEVTHWHLTKRDKFVVLATDGVKQHSLVMFEELLIQAILCHLGY